MYPISVIVILLIFFIALAYSLLAKHRDKISNQGRRLQDPFWRRRNKIPLLIEYLREAQVDDKLIQKLLTLRTQAMESSPQRSLQDEVLLEMQIGHLLTELLLRGQENPSLSAQSGFLGVVSQLKKEAEEIEKELNDYNYLVTEWCNKLSRPWYMFLAFGFPGRLKSPLKRA